MDCLKQVYATALLGREVKRRQVIQRKAGTADDNPLGEFEQSIGLMPVPQIQKTVCADKIEQDSVGLGLPQLR